MGERSTHVKDGVTPQVTRHRRCSETHNSHTAIHTVSGGAELIHRNELREY